MHRMLEGLAPEKVSVSVGRSRSSSNRSSIHSSRSGMLIKREGGGGDECSVRQLALEIENVYKGGKKRTILSRRQLEMKIAVLAANSSLSPRKLVSVDKEDL
jgi:hypothetical protein